VKLSQKKKKKTHGVAMAMGQLVTDSVFFFLEFLMLFAFFFWDTLPDQRNALRMLSTCLITALGSIKISN
jgi:hypothetical protein